MRRPRLLDLFCGAGGASSNRWLWRAGGCACAGRWTVGVYGNGAGGIGKGRKVGGPGTAAAARVVMGIEGMNRRELSQAIPPAYTRFLGAQLIDHLNAETGHLFEVGATT
jgi:DNA (cytosine-5)-methyltransferase 1